VPLGGPETLLDAMAALGWPAVLVTGSYLGTLSHTLTAARALAGAGVNLAGVVISESPESPVPPAETAAALSRYVTSVPVIVLPRLPASPGPKRDAPDLSVLAPPV
jgi:dethiobiotin synthetase